MNEQTEKLAEELNTVCTHTGWHGLSKHVQKLILEARIDELKIADIHETWKIQRLSELQKQLTEV